MYKLYTITGYSFVEIHFLIVGARAYVANIHTLYHFRVFKDFIECYQTETDASSCNVSSYLRVISTIVRFVELFAYQSLPEHLRNINFFMCTAAGNISMT